jgi:hypothetical protein
VVSSSLKGIVDSDSSSRRASTAALDCHLGRMELSLSTGRKRLVVASDRQWNVKAETGRCDTPYRRLIAVPSMPSTSYSR